VTGPRLRARHPSAALLEAVEWLWQVVERAAGEGTLDTARRRELERHGRHILSGIIRRGVRSGAFRPRCALWAVVGLPFAIVAGAGARWVFGLRKGRWPTARTAATAALRMLGADPLVQQDAVTSLIVARRIRQPAARAALLLRR
jgi:hypothetical protein